MTAPVRFLPEALVLLVHEDQIRAFGGMQGVRDIELMRSALGQAQQTYGYTGDVFEAAAAYAHSLAKNRPFLDGNKRTAAACMTTFLVGNGWWLRFSQIDLVDWLVRIAIDQLDRPALAALLRQHTERKG
ncbi:type II toxin-antitoxin system death-on-curing family toxin [Chitinimonas koreensis]|uniref:type II toxin-antitoxin system death-on-curing family toxin n=1 Tax=Chitinimonas koreensis TaxID=356302 RepID=UPI00040F2512|nr:type II toxin-antitoxin system death-on-curing family toxin [Chitinimonas koreensis]QNM95257.1 type II toxin-antitoxin system death-on-curing family toxin [Chitinimonas koreensis]